MTAEAAAGAAAPGTFHDGLPQRFADPLPEAADVVVIGGGVIGVSAAFELAGHGVSVVLCEKGRIAGEQSSRNWGWVRQQGRDAAELPIMMEANRIWRDLERRTGEDLGFAAHGILYLADSETALEERAEWLEVARTHQLDTRLLGRREVEALVDGRPGAWCGALFTPSDGRAEPWLAVPGIARAAQRAGAVVAEQCAVRTLERAGGRITGVVTERGRIRCEQVILAGGAWSSLFLANEGLALPQLSVLSSAARTAPAPEVFAGNASDGTFSFRRRQDGGYSVAASGRHSHFIGPGSFRHLKPWLKAAFAKHASLRYRLAAPAGYPDAWHTPRRWHGDGSGPFEAVRVLNPAPAPDLAARAQALMAERLPALADVPVIETWAGLIDVMPDMVPVIDRAPRPEGLIVATGFSGHGFGIGPAVGRILADLARGRPAGHDMARFRFGRFADGSALELGPAL